MYTSIKNVQILISLLKEYNIRRIVISPGGNNIPIIHSVETDPFFTCYSVVDERSAAYFAMGLSQVSIEPIGILCTSGTAVCNYMPAVTEAYYQRVPLVVITSDRSPYLLNQLETQKIDQRTIFGSMVAKEVTLPIVKNDDDEWFCSRLINEAFISQKIAGNVPIHINVPTVGNVLEFNGDTLPSVSKIDLVTTDEMQDPNVLSKYVGIINKSNRILAVVGENYLESAELARNISTFCSYTSAVCLVDHMSNVEVPSAIPSYRIAETMTDEDFEELSPDLVITLGNNILSNNFKRFLRQKRKTIIHWSVDEAGEVRDVFKSLHAIFRCSSNYFFEHFNCNVNKKGINSYYEKWKAAYLNTKFDNLPFSSLSVIKKLAELIPSSSVVHTAILNSTRGMNLFNLKTNIKVFSNIGALGIDGCLSTLIGHSFATDNLCFLIIGDLSFFYDMNSIGIRGIRNNVRILLLNNEGGAEFHFNTGKNCVPTLNDYISVKHNKVAEGWVKSLGFEYIPVRIEEEVEPALLKLTSESNKPICVELFTDMEKDAMVVKEAISNVVSTRSAKNKIKGSLKKILGRL